MKVKRNPHLHSREHVLADDLMHMMGEPKRFAAYLGIAKRFRESDLRRLARKVREKADLPLEARGKYFFAALRGLVPAQTARKNATKRKGPTKKRNKRKHGNTTHHPKNSA